MGISINIIFVFLITVAATTGVAFAVQHTFTINGVSTDSAVFRIVHDDAPGQLRFEDDGGNIYTIRHPPSGGRIEWVDLSGTPRVDFSIQTSTGNVAINKINGDEKLDVNGNIKLSGDIISDVPLNIRSLGDICIGACP